MGTIWPDTLPREKGPKYKLVADTIRKSIEDKVLQPGAKLPPVRELAYQLSITPGTVARAYTILTDEGLLQAEVGRGTFVAPPKTDQVGVAPIEVDVIAHNSEGGDGYTVNLFSPHLPGVGQSKLIRHLLGEIAQDPPSGLMHYPSRAGSLPARRAAVQWLSRAPIGRIREGDVVLTNGGQNAISLIMQAVLRGRRPAILVEELSYPGFRRAADLLRAEVVPVAMDKHGVIPAALDAAARAHDAQIFCTSPEVHNPTCLFTPLERREALVRVARQRDFSILEDDCYRHMPADAPSYRVLAPERSWFVNSISKSITPALRIGVAVAPDGHIADLRRAAEHGFFGLATPLIDLTAKLLAHPQLDAMLEELQRVTGDYIKAAVNILGAYQLSWRPPVPFLWLTLPEGWRAASFCRAAEAEGIQIRSAEEFACRTTRTPHAVRLAVNAGVSLATFEAAMTRLRHLLDNPPERIGV
ncbi:PLP-dependent aminotransferase family protein [Ruegeria sp. 2205SS24-7]|uniref:aminotransferase-like domain-containing protein n=1 Tax=Ruegeria discodermiae TaxID=3064389 RepID=UPI00274211F5|nr:PLP-dependent aminotransferase family protein [Ruegeria sp. 2205SS24-7]MDP5216329.1 PLP-dependent aminotransferase family protein [Ruegeria sp. 2205SS24-7]